MVTLKKPRVGVLEVGFGNLPSLRRIFQQLNVNFDEVFEPDQLDAVDCLVIPGVGAFDSAMNFLNSRGFVEHLRDRCLKTRKPTMGICLGGQILLERGFENKLTPGVGIFSGQVVKSSDRLNSLNSHNGWDSVHVTRSFLNLGSGTSFDAYFNHNYIFDDTETTDVCAVSEFGGTFPVILEKNGTLAIQFHPEKSQSFGLKIIDEFLKTAHV